MRFIVGHTNMDLDCLGSIAIARALFPGSRALRSSQIHPVARNLYNLYADHLDLGMPAEAAGAPVESMIVVDTRSLGRMKEFLPVSGALPPFEVWDHHPADSSDIPGAIIHEGPVGANTTLLGMEGIKCGIRLCPEDATIALAGIYADTGNFTHENVSLADFEVAGWLKGQGASIALVRSFLQTLQEESQITLFHDLLNRLTYQTVHGHLVVTTYMEMERQVGGLAAVVEKVFEVENPDAIFCVFFFRRENETLIIARSGQRSLDVSHVLGVFGGGGHPQASSALLKGEPGRRSFHALQACLKTMLTDATNAAAIMSTDVVTILDSWTLTQASLFLAKMDRTGAPVINAAGEFCGYLSLRDIVKGERGNPMSAPVRSHMVRKVVAGSPSMSLREIESLFFSHTIYDLPIVEAHRIVGIVTRERYLKARAGE